MYIDILINDQAVFKKTNARIIPGVVAEGIQLHGTGGGAASTSRLIALEHVHSYKVCSLISFQSI